MKELPKKVHEPIRDFSRRIPESLKRILTVFIVLIGGTIVVIKFIIPPHLKSTDIQWAEAIERELSREIKYAGSSACTECHDDTYDVKKSGYHRNVACETCHGPAFEHTEDPDEITPKAPRGRKFCPLCHTYNQSRPRGFPQINPDAHNPMEPCIECHDPHDPVPPTIPAECSACHGEIARTKAVSHHVNLECTTCHQTPEEHKVTPRTVRPSKPDDREFCGQCHTTGLRGAPEIEIDTHGEKYLCWQCHYPHLPEVD